MTAHNVVESVSELPFAREQVRVPAVTRMQVGVESRRFEQHWRTLDAAERLLAGRFRNAADRLRFVIARGSLRQLLGSHLRVAPESIVFTKNPFGKPLLQNASATLHFNVSHSGDWVLLATDPHAPVGIDIEAVRPEMADINQFRHVLAAEELTFLNALPTQQRAHAFAAAWVRKEAYVKALGEGMSRPLQDISVAVDTGGQPRLRYDHNATGWLEHWRFEDIEIDPGHVACLVYRGTG